ncbi:MAG: hypothetical protein Kow00121_14640 [Elainellaceae cyanobacterium]
MLKNFPLFQNLTQFIDRPKTQSEDPAIDIWAYAEPAGEEPDPLKRNVLQWRRILTSVRDPIAEFAGQQVNVIGFVHRPSLTPPSQFVLARQIIRCCLADTVPLGLSIHTESASAYANDTWLRVQGQFITVAVRNHSALVIHPVSIEVIEHPQKAYINGVF